MHHFKWRGSVLAYLRTRAAMLTAGTWREHTSAMRAEANLLLDHVTTHRGRIAVDDPGLGFKPVNLDALPAWWPAQAHAIVTGWRPPARPPGNHAALLRAR